MAVNVSPVFAACTLMINIAFDYKYAAAVVASLMVFPRTLA